MTTIFSLLRRAAVLTSVRHWLLPATLPVALACGSPAPPDPQTPTVSVLPTPATLAIVGDTADVTVPTRAGTVLMGGSTDVDAAMRWLLGRAPGGDVVVLRASGGTGYNEYLFDLSEVNSVETLRISNRTLADDPAVARRIRQAEVLFIAGGDQYDYVRDWQNSAVLEAIRYLIEEKKVPVGGTSAGCAVLGGVVFDAGAGTVTSREALDDPLRREVSLRYGDFLRVPFLERTVTDTHYDDPDRRGRHLVFLARMAQRDSLPARGIGVQERTAVCIDTAGRAVVLGSGRAFFLRADSLPEVCRAGEPLRWDRGGRAVRVCVVPAGADQAFDLTTEVATGGTWQWWGAEGGRLRVTE